jgi:hypothetical protein
MCVMRNGEIGQLRVGLPQRNVVIALEIVIHLADECQVFAEFPTITRTRRRASNHATLRLLFEDESLHPQSRSRDMPQISQGKFNRFRRATAGFTTSELDG